MNKRLILIITAIVLIIISVVIFLIREKKEEIRKEEEAGKREAKTMTEVLKDLTASGASPSLEVSPKVIKSLTAPQTKENQELTIPKEVIDSLAAPR